MPISLGDLEVARVSVRAEACDAAASTWVVRG